MKLKWVVALAVGIGVGVLHFVYVNALAAEARGGAKVSVLVVTKSVRSGTVLDKNILATRAIPAAYVDSRVIRDEKGVMEKVVNTPVAVDVQNGQMLQWTDFEERLDGRKSDLAQFIETGKRAMTIPVDASLSMGGMLKPGHRVDIVWTFTKGESMAGKKVTKTLLQNVTVLATGDDLFANAEKKNSSGFKTVSLNVDLDQAQLLALASEKGSLSLVLRGYQDLETLENVPEKNLDDIWSNGKKKLKTAGAAKNNNTIERLFVR